MVRLTNLKVPLDYTEEALKTILLKKLKLNPSDLVSFSISRRSIDARDKQDVHFVLSLDLSLKNETGALRKNKNLMESTMMNFTDMMNQEQLDFENMSDAQKEKWLGDMVPSINTGIAEMIGKFSTDPDSFKQIIIDATQAMDNERKTYQQGLADL